jgi:flagellar hook-length control protein FliK
MINFFPIIPAANTSGVGLPGNAGMTGNATNATDSLFSILLQKLNGTSGNADSPQGPALLMNPDLTDPAIGSKSTDSNGISVNNSTCKKVSKSSVESFDLTLPAAVVPQLISFLKTKGFSTDRIDKMILSSTNEEGLVQMDKLAAFMKSTGKELGSNMVGGQGHKTGLIVENASIPKVQETLFKMGLGVGEVKSVIEKSINMDGSLSLDKLTGALKETASTGNITSAELISTGLTLTEAVAPQLDKPATAMKSTVKVPGSGIIAGHGHRTGLTLENASIPKVQEMLFKMGLGVGEVKSAVEKSVNQDGSLSLDKLAGALKGINATGTFTRAELVSTLAQNNVSVLSPATDMVPVNPSPINNVASEINVNADLKSHVINIISANPSPINNIASDINGGFKSNDTEIIAANPSQIDNITSDMSAADSALTRGAALNTEGSEIKKAALDLKKEFISFTRGTSLAEHEITGQKITASLNVKDIPSQDVESANDWTTGSDIKAASDISKAVASSPMPEAGQITDQAAPKGHTKWQKGVEGKVISIVANKNNSIAKADEASIAPQKTAVVLDFKDALKQENQKSKQEVVSTVASNNTAPDALIVNARDSKVEVLNFNEATPVAGLDPQNISRIAEGADLKIKAKVAHNLPEPLPKIFDRMVIMIKNGEQTGKLIIQPPELGKIDINLTIKDGHVQASLSTENYAVKEIIETNLNQLKQQLTDQGLIVEQFNVSVGSQHKQFGDENGRAWNKGAGSSKSGTSGISEVTSIADGASSMINGRYRVDVRV